MVDQQHPDIHEKGVDSKDRGYKGPPDPSPRQRFISAAVAIAALSLFVGLWKIYVLSGIPTPSSQILFLSLVGFSILLYKEVQEMILEALQENAKRRQKNTS